MKFLTLFLMVLALGVASPVVVTDAYAGSHGGAKAEEAKAADAGKKAGDAKKKKEKEPDCD